MASRGSSSESSITFFFFILIATTGPLLFCESVTKTMAPPENATDGRIPAAFIFGDSILDTGNNNYIATLTRSNFPPYGMDFPGRIPTGRFSDGRLISDFIVEISGLKYLVPPYFDPNLRDEDLVTGVCLASAGSGYDPETSTILSVLSTPNQLNLFQQYVGKLKTLLGESKSSDVVENSLYVISSGNNDIGVTYFLFRQMSPDMASYADFLVGQASTFIRKLYGLGARKIAYLSTIVTGCVPASRTVFGGIGRSCFDESNELATMFNEKLSYEIARLNDDVDLPNVSIVFVDVFTPLFDIITNPENYGFVNAKDGCCGTGEIEFGVLCNPSSPTCIDPSKYVFWDSVHLTEKAYKIVFTEVRKSINKLF